MRRVWPRLCEAALWWHTVRTCANVGERHHASRGRDGRKEARTFHPARLARMPVSDAASSISRAVSQSCATLRHARTTWAGRVVPSLARSAHTTAGPTTARIAVRIPPPSLAQQTLRLCLEPRYIDKYHVIYLHCSMAWAVDARRCSSRHSQQPAISAACPCPASLLNHHRTARTVRG